jgi:OmcA/MtrC family decaheme c-type cytochrome
MQRKSIKTLCMFIVLAASAAFTLNGCSGDNGANGANGTNAAAPTTGTVSASTFTNDNLNSVVLTGKIISASIPGKNPVVTFQVVDKVSGAGITGLKTFGLHIAKLVPEANGSSSYWVNYIDKGISLPAPLAFAITGSGASAKAVTGAITKPSADPGKTLVPANQNGLDLTQHPVGSVLLPGYTVVDNGDGTYTATFGSDVTSNPNAPFDPNAITRIGVTVTSIATPGVTATGPLTPAGVVNTSFLAQNRLALTYDFTPATGAIYTNPNGGNNARDIVTADACNQCHYKVTLISGHTGSRADVKICVMCHTKTNTSGEGEFVTFIHRIHMGKELPAVPQTEAVLNPTKPLPHGALVTYKEQTYPQDIRNCIMCHTGVDGANWSTKPNVTNCGSCHNGINFATGAGTTNAGAATGHVGGAQANDNGCILCHGTAAVGASHVAVIKPDPNNIFSVPVTGNSRTNAAYVAAAGVVPAGAAKITYNISSVTVAGTPARASVKFQLLKDGVPQTLNTYVDATTELLPGFVGSTNIYVAYAVPQDGITAPADFNKTINVYLRDLLNPANTKGVLTGPDASKFYTVTLGAGAAATTSDIPASAVMVTGGIGYAYSLSATTQPFTQIDVPGFTYNADKTGGLIVPAPNVWKVATGYTARRTIVSNAKCNACHARLGVVPSFHVGQRNDAPTCSFCHNPNTASSGYAANASTFIHGIHGAEKRSNKYGWHAVSATEGFWEVTYPGYLRNCEQCHLSGTYDFSDASYTTTNAAGVALQNRLLFTTDAYGTSANSSLVPPDPTLGFSTATIYGTAFSYAADTNTTVPFASTTLVTSPITAACFSCHDTALAKAHMTQNGGAIYEARATALTKQETCLVCHGTASNTLNATVPTIKAVHRWW